MVLLSTDIPSADWTPDEHCHSEPLLHCADGYPRLLLLRRNKCVPQNIEKCQEIGRNK